MSAARGLACLALLMLMGTAAHAIPPGDLGGFAYRQRLGSALPLGAMFRDSDGSTVRLGTLTSGAPIILALGYFHCPNLCGVVREDLIHALAASRLRAGPDYTLVVLSIDPAETVRDAAAAKAADAASFDGQGGTAAWHYLTGSAAAIGTVADAVGFRDRADAQTKQFLHPAGLVFATPSGIVSSYLLGVGYTPTDMHAALARAQLGGIARAGLPVLLICFHFDPTTGRYTLAIMKLVRLAGVLTLLTLAGLLAMLFRRERHGA